MFPFNVSILPRNTILYILLSWKYPELGFIEISHVLLWFISKMVILLSLSHYKVRESKLKLFRMVPIESFNKFFLAQIY